MAGSSKFDMTVIGSGPAGQRAAIQAAKLNKRVLIVEKEFVGGACVHKGTIPSKTLREAAITSNNNLNGNTLEWAMQKKEEVIKREVAVTTDQLHRNGVQIIQGLASFINDREINIVHGDEILTIESDFYVIATGASPLQKDDVPFDHRQIFTSDSILTLTALPNTLAVLGAGVIGTEYASIFNRLGVKVSLIDRRKSLLRGVDNEVVNALIQQFEDQGVDLFIGDTVGEIKLQNNTPGNGAVTININGKDVDFNAALISMGRQGNVSELNLARAGIEADKRGLIKVNDNFQTTVPHIYAAGDVIGAPSLAASSFEQGRICARHAFCLEGGSFPPHFPFGIYTIPEISWVGEDELELIKKGIPFVTGRAKYKELAKGQISGEKYGFLKIHVHRETHKILGVHIIGRGATELVHIGQMALSLCTPIEHFVYTVFNYPTLAEAYKVAALDVLNQLDVAGKKDSCQG